MKLYLILDPRVVKAIHDIRQTVAPYQYPDQLFANEIVGLEGYNDIPVAVRQAAHRGIVNMGEQRIADLISIHIFVAGLKSYLRDKCVTRVFNTYYEAYTHATSLEHNMTDPKKSAHVSEIEEDEDQGSDPEISELESQINALRFKIKNKQNFRGNRFRRGGNNSNNSTQRRDYSAYTCRYCNIKGHIQSQCRKRIAAGAPLVDSKGNKMQQVREIEKDQPPQGDTPAQATTSTTAPQQMFNPFVSTIDYTNQHLNWY
jgi:hypothetical protein